MNELPPQVGGIAGVPTGDEADREIRVSGEPVVGGAAALTWREYWRDSRASLLAVTLCLTGVFLPVLVVPYAFSDDYPTLWMAVSGEPNKWFGRSVLEAYAVQFRPITGVVSTLLFSAAGAIDNLRFVRLVGLLGIVGLAVLLHRALVGARFRPAWAALIVLFVCCMPAFQVCASWALLFFAPYAAILGGGASRAATSMADGSPKPGAVRFGLAVAALVGALLTYQPAAMFFWVFLAVALAGLAQDASRARRVLLSHAAVAAVALPSAFAVGKLSAAPFQSSSYNAARASFTHDLVGKAVWFVGHPLFRSASLFELTNSPWVAGAVAAGVGGMLVWVLQRSARPRLFVAAAFALVALAFLPNLIVEENNSLVFRTGIALTSLLALYLCFGILGISMLVRDRLGQRLGARVMALVRGVGFAVASACIAAAAWNAAANVRTLVVEPQHLELRILRNAIAQLPDDIPRLGFVQLGWDDGLTRAYSDELGLASSARPWVPAAAVRLILREQGRYRQGTAGPVVEVRTAASPGFPGVRDVIDLRELRTLR